MRSLCLIPKVMRRTLDWAIQWATVLLSIGVLGLIGIELYRIFLVEIWTGNTHYLIASIIWTFVLIKLFGILHTYLLQGFIKVERVVEVAIIAIVQELILKIFEIEPQRIYALSALLLALGVLFFIEKRFAAQRGPERGNGR